MEKLSDCPRSHAGKLVPQNPPLSLTDPAGLWEGSSAQSWLRKFHGGVIHGEPGAVRVQPSDPTRMLWKEAPKLGLRDHIQQGWGWGAKAAEGRSEAPQRAGAREEAG